MGQERVKGEAATKVEIVLGVLFVLGALSSLGQGHLYSSQAVFSTVGMLFLGAYLLVRGIEWGQLVKAYRSYSTLLAHSPSGSISEIASAEGTTTEVVKRNLKLMIKRGMATNTAIDEQNNRVVSAMAGSVAAPAGNRQVPGPQAVAYQQHATPEMVVVECPSCGAKNSIPRGAIAQCGHCGAQIDAR